MSCGNHCFCVLWDKWALQVGLLFCLDWQVFATLLFAGSAYMMEDATTACLMWQAIFWMIVCLDIVAANKLSFNDVVQGDGCESITDETLCVWPWVISRYTWTSMDSRRLWFYDCICLLLYWTVLWWLFQGSQSWWYGAWFFWQRPIRRSCVYFQWNRETSRMLWSNKSWYCRYFQTWTFIICLIPDLVRKSLRLA